MKVKCTVLLVSHSLPIIVVRLNGEHNKIKLVSTVRFDDGTSNVHLMLADE